MIAVAASGTIAAAQDQEPAQFRSSVEVTPADVTVVDQRGQPITDLTADDFTVRIDGAARRVQSAEWISLVKPEDSRREPPPEGYSSNQNLGAGRLVLIVIDQPNIQFGNVVHMQAAVGRFLDGLPAGDLVAALGVGPASPGTTFTTDRARVKAAITRMPGAKREMVRTQFNIALTEALEVRNGSSFAKTRVTERECANIPRGSPDRQVCEVAVEVEAQAIAFQAEREGQETIVSLRVILNALRAIDAPKTLVLVSEGFLVGTETPILTDLEKAAAASRTSIYAFRLDESFDMAKAQPAPVGTGPQDRYATREGLALITTATRGTLFDVVAKADYAFDRMQSEMSGYYLLGLESLPSDKDGRRHTINVNVNRRGVTVRSRRQLADYAEKGATGPREAMVAALNSPLLLSALPLRVASYSLRASETSKVQLLIHADVGEGYSASRVVSVGYLITDKDGRIVESQAADARLQPVMQGVPSPLQFTGGASLSPGDYVLRLSVAEGDRVGTLEHPIRAGLVDAGDVQLSEFTVGGPVDDRDLLRPTVGHTISFGSVHGYLEAYGQRSSSLHVKYEVASRIDGPALLDEEVEARTVSNDRSIFSLVMPVRQLPPGKYVLRAVVSLESSPVETIARTFEIAPPAVLMTSADSGARPATNAGDLFLPVEETLLVRPFNRDAVWRPDIVQRFRARVGDGARRPFEAGIGQLTAGDLARAEESFKQALQVDDDSTAPLAYLAATFAASGHDLEAANAWQTSLVNGSDFPEIYQWLGDALMRTHDYAKARVVLDEAVEKWPADARFAKPLALMSATFGQGREAVRLLQRHLEHTPNDAEALALGVEWLYHLHAAGAVARSRGDDVKLARTYAEAYINAKGPQVELVKQWLAFLERR
jgi:VWFA-related protein